MFSTGARSTLSRFRKQLSAHGLEARLLDVVNRHLDERGLILRPGTLIRKAIMTPANTHDNGPADGLINGDEAVI